MTAPVEHDSRGDTLAMFTAAGFGTGGGGPLPAPRPGMPAAGGGSANRPGNGAVRQSNVYYDPAGRRRRSSTPVPVDQYGQISGVQYRCRKCKQTRWFPAAIARGGVPVCETDGQRMIGVPLSSPSLIPWRALRGVAVGSQMRAVWGLLLVGALGAGAHEQHVPMLMLAGSALPAGVLAGFVVRSKLLARARRRGPLGDDEPGRRRRATVARRARTVGAYTTVAFGWLAVAAHTGVDPHTLGGRIALTALAVLWLPPAATWWRWLRRLAQHRAATKPDTLEVETDNEVPMDPDEAQTRRVWDTIVAVRKGAVVAVNAVGAPAAVAGKAGKLVDARLDDWHTVVGGWAATVVGPDGQYTGDAFLGARGAIASAFRAKTSMVTIIPDSEDENRALVLVQRTSPISDVVRWAGPESVDSVGGTAPVARYVDGTLGPYEIFRPEFGSPHVLACGTTGSGKSEYLSLLFLIDRYAHRVADDGTRHGIVCSFLIDPQQGQSFAPFLDDLAGPVACSLDEAMLLVTALHAEALRRNWYLARVPWTDGRGRQRKGRKWWNPHIDGPILTLTIDEAWMFLAHRPFAVLIEAAARMWRKCGLQIRLGTHTPLLTDLGGSMALRDMLTGGFVWIGRTANSLTGPVAFNGRLPVDPRTIEAIPGTAYILSGLAPQAMKARTMWEPDWYEWIRDADDQPIGYPAALPEAAVARFGPDYAAWVRHVSEPDAGVWVPPSLAPAPVEEAPATCVDAVRSVLAQAAADGADPLDMDALDKALRTAGLMSANGKPYSTRTVRAALTQLRKDGDVTTVNGRHQLTAAGQAKLPPPVDDGLSDAA